MNKDQVTWKGVISALITMGAILWAIQGRVDNLQSDGLRIDMSNTDAMLQKQIDTINSRMDSWQKSTDTVNDGRH